MAAAATAGTNVSGTSRARTHPLSCSGLLVLRTWSATAPALLTRAAQPKAGC